jgi:hypothetical protein
MPLEYRIPKIAASHHGGLILNDQAGFSETIPTRNSSKSGHAVGKCPRAPTGKMWSFRQEYFCAPCRSYHFGGDRMHGYMLAR